MKKRFIEWDLPLAEISEASAREKNIRHGHPSTLHIWWAHRPLASSRATNFAALIDLPDQEQKRKEIYELIKQISPWEIVKNGNDANIKKAQEIIKEQWNNNPPKVLDPFAGGGAIPLEALRLGCETYASDYNPVAVFIEKATLEWPQKFGIDIPHPDKKPGVDGKVEKVNFLAYMVEKWGNIIREQVKEAIGQFYPEESDGSIPMGYIWARTIPCQNPSCVAEIPLVRQFWLAKKNKTKVAYKLFVDKKKKNIEFELIEGNMGNFDPGEGTISGGTVRCPVCQQTFKSAEIRRLALEGKMGERMIAVVTYHPKKKRKAYRIVNEDDVLSFNNASAFLQEKIESWPFIDSPLPDEQIRTPDGKEVVDSTGSYFVHLPPVIYGMAKWQDLFNPRQKLSLITFIEKIKMVHQGIKEECKKICSGEHRLDSEEAAKSIMGYLGLIMSRHSSYNSNLCWWEPTGERSFNVFGRQALPMVWDHSEQNPFGILTGNWNTQVNISTEIIVKLTYTSKTPALIYNSSSSNLPFENNHFDAIFTDPPYYDNVPYADLSDFFYVWLKRSVGDVFPELFPTPLTPKSDECIENESLLRRSKYIIKESYEDLSIKNMDYFNARLTDSFKEIFRVLKQNGIATIVYAHKTTEGWETILNSLVNAGLVVTASWPLHTEMNTRLRASASAALASSIYMVCRKTERKKVGFYSEIKPQIKERIEQKLKQFWSEGISGGDFFISAIGPGMEIFSQYERVEKLSGERVTTAELLEYIRSVSTDFIVNQLLHDVSSARIDNASEFYLAYRWTYMDNTVEYDDARKLASASGFSLEDHWGPDGFVKKKGSSISILGPRERDEIKHVDNMVDVMHRCLLLWEQGERDEITRVLAETGFKDDPAFKQFCQAVAESLLNGNKEKQLLEGFLIGIDSYAKARVKMHRNQTGLNQFGGR